MRNLKKFLALVLAMVMALSLMVSANAATYWNPNTDYPDFDSVTPDFKEAVDVLAGMGVMTGDNGSFYPERTIMRSEMAAIMYRLMTGDTSNMKNMLYAEQAAARFSDVKESDWFASYIGWCYDAGLMKGHNGKVRPWDPVTGYEAEIMILRAMGYGKNGEYNGTYWSVNASSDATLIGLLNGGIQNTNYKNTLAMPSRRDVVASMVFAGAKLPTVTYTPSMGYNKYIGVASAQGGNYLNPSLGYKNFGLTNTHSAIVANQATGAGGTTLGYSEVTTSRDNIAKDDYGYKIVVQYDPGTKNVKQIITKFDNNGAENAAYKAAFKNIATETFNDDYGWLTIGSSSIGTGDWAPAYNYGAANTLTFDVKTGLDQFAHEVTMWYDSRNDNADGKGNYHTYALIDHNTSDDPFFADDNTCVGNDDNSKTDFGVTGATKNTVWWSDRFSQIGQLAYNATTNLSPISTYRKVVNPNMGTVYIALSAEVADVAQKNSTAADPYIILGTDLPNNSKFSTTGDPSNPGDSGMILIDNLTADTDKKLYEKPGQTVTAYEVLGTSFKLGDHSDLTLIPGVDPQDGTTWQGDVMYKLETIKTKTVTVSSFQADSSFKIDGIATDPVTKVFAANGETLNVSGITLGDRITYTSKIVSGALPIVVKTVDTTSSANWNTDLKANTTYVAYLDIVGRFVSMIPLADYKFLYGTYADYTIGGQGTGTIGYNMVGVDWDGKIQAANELKSLTLNVDSVGGVADTATVITTTSDPAGTVNLIDGVVYSKITTTKKDQGTTANTLGNEIKDGYDTGYMYNASTGDLAEWAGRKLGATDATGINVWTITAQDATNGFVRVQNNGTDYLLTKDTHFIVVSGTGTATLKVAEYDGLAKLLDGATSASIAYDGGDTLASWNEVIFRTEADVYGNFDTSDNGVVTDVILSEENLNRWNTQTLYYDFNQQTGGTGVVLPGADPTKVQQFNLWQNGKMESFFIDITLGDATNNVADLEVTAPAKTDSMFFTLAKAYEVNGTPVYMVIKAPAATGETAGIGGLQGSGFSAQTTTYDYVTVSNLHTGMFTDTSNGKQLVLNMDNVTVCDVQFKTTTNAKAQLGRNEITNVLELNNAVSVGKQNTSPNYTIDVAVVYNTSNASAVTVYVLNVTPTT